MTDSKRIVVRKIIDIFLIILTGCIIGWIYEMLFYRIDAGHFIKRGQGLGPWLPIYGFGAVGVMVLTYGRKLSAKLVFLITAIGSGIFELAVGWGLYQFADGLRLWDYNVEIWSFGNIGGFVCLRSVLIFGLLGVLFYKAIMPVIMGLTRKISLKALILISAPLFLLFFSDIVYGYIIKPIIAALG